MQARNETVLCSLNTGEMHTQKERGRRQSRYATKQGKDPSGNGVLPAQLSAVICCAASGWQRLGLAAGRTRFRRVRSDLSDQNPSKRKR